MTAVLSPDGRYRYALWRDTGALGGEGTVLFVMLNPSTADAEQDDPTIRRCIRFARDWGYARLAVGNLYALRATDPQALLTDADPVGPENDAWLQRLSGNALERVVAWGANRAVAARAEAALRILTYGGSLGVRCLAQTKDLHPHHPLRLPAALRPKPFVRRAAAA